MIVIYYTLTFLIGVIVGIGVCIYIADNGYVSIYNLEKWIQIRNWRVNKP
jgi:hypothetical protein